MAETARFHPIVFMAAIVLFPGTASAQGVVLSSMTAGECELRVEADTRWNTLELRARHPRGERCHVTKKEMTSVLDRAFSRTNAQRLLGVHSSFGIGRLIDFPWLSQHLAAAARRDPAWDSRKGRPAGMGINEYVSRLLSRKEVTAEIEAPFRKAGYRIAGASVEKVLVGSLSQVPLHRGRILPGKVPFDALTWFRLEKLERGEPHP